MSDGMRSKVFEANRNPERTAALEAENDRLREALRSIYALPCAYPDDSAEDRKLADRFAEAQDIAHDVLVAQEPRPAPGAERLRDALRFIDSALMAITNDQPLGMHGAESLRGYIASALDERQGS